MEKQLGGHLPAQERKQFLLDNCEKVENVGYMKKFTHEELGLMKDRLSDVSIVINDISIEKSEVTKTYTDKLKPYEKEKGSLLSNLKNKAVFVDEECYKFVDEEEGMVSFYNVIGDLVSSRPMLPSEKQKSIFRIEKTGTND